MAVARGRPNRVAVQVMPELPVDQVFQKVLVDNELAGEGMPREHCILE